ncbi:MAG: hypothetical protein GXY13_10235 [Acidimicrobiales bacterium]|nr:hypothetical protein [Acidimicrobiales bacterium]
MKVRAIGTLALGAALVVTAGCGKVAEKAAEKTAEKVVEDQTGGSVDFDADDGGIDIETEDGSLSIGTGDVPEEWPADIPLDVFEVETSSSSRTDGLSIYLSGPASSSVDDVVAAYRDALSDWDETGDLSSSTGDFESATVSFEDGDRTLTLNVVEDAGDTQVSLSYSAPE